MTGPFERGVVILSFDTEQIWGYADLLAPAQFDLRYPNALGTHDYLLDRLCAAGIGATWFLVGGLSLPGSLGARDPRMADLPACWTRRIPEGDEATAPIWYRRSFVERLRDSQPRQEIGLHGGLTHLIWTHADSTPAIVRRELAEGIRALEQAGAPPAAFSFPRDEQAYLDLLPAHGIHCYRGRLQVRSHLLGRTMRGTLLRLFDELRLATPVVVWPQESQPGLWSVPASMFLYPIGGSRTKIVGLRTRVERFSRGIQAAARYRGIFHFCLHPENLAESRQGLALFDDMLERLVRARERGDVEILNLTTAAARMRAFTQKLGAGRTTAAGHPSAL